MSRSGADGGEPAKVAAGEQLIAQNNATSIRKSPIAVKDVGSWRLGRLVYNDAPLSIVAADITRYSGRTIIVDPSLRNKRFSGVLAIGDGSKLLANLAGLMALSYRVEGDRAFASVLLAVAEPAPAPAHDTEYPIDLPAGPIGASLSALSQATGISVGLAGQLPPVQARRLKGSLTPAEALRRLLAGTGFTAVQIGPSDFLHRAAAGGCAATTCNRFRPPLFDRRMPRLRHSPKSS